MKGKMLEESREDNESFESELEETVDLLERLPEEQKIDYTSGRQTQYLLDSEEHTTEEVQDYFHKLEQEGILQIAGERDRYHRLTVDTNKLEEYVD